MVYLPVYSDGPLWASLFCDDSRKASDNRLWNIRDLVCNAADLKLASKDLAEPFRDGSHKSALTNAAAVFRRQFEQRKGGQSVPAEKRSFSQDVSLAAAAGCKGGQSVDPKKRSFFKDLVLASKAGAKGGHASHGGGRSRPADK
jgi:general stress protein YciG